MILSYLFEYGVYILIGLDLYQSAAVFLDSWKPMKILYEVLASLHHTMASLDLPEEITVFSHSREDLIECWLIVAREKSPRVTERCSPDHKAIKIFESSRMYHLRNTILI